MQNIKFQNHFEIFLNQIQSIEDDDIRKKQIFEFLENDKNKEEI